MTATWVGSEPASRSPVDVARAQIKDVADGLVGACMYRMCPGPDAPMTPMATCHACGTVIELREIIAEWEAAESKTRGGQ